jgi:protein-S-isoprenylcysteine O-methyltransferase Ste14
MNFALFKKSSAAKIGELAPLFELKGRAARIELSAYVAGLSYFSGVMLAGEKTITTAIANAPWVFLVIAGCFAAFLALVVIIQGRMGFAASANTFGTPNQLVTEGIFQYSRNPIFLAFWLPLLSLTLLSIPAGLFALALYIVAMNLTVLRTEERDLTKLFGHVYTAYAAKVPRWIFV